MQIKKNDVMFMLFQFLCGDGYILPIKISNQQVCDSCINKMLCNAHSHEINFDVQLDS